MKKILFAIEDLQTNGGAKSLLGLLATLKNEPYNISVFLFSHAGELTKELPPYVNLLPEIPVYAVTRLPLKKAIFYALRRFRPDLALLRLIIAISRHYTKPFPCWFALPTLKEHYDVAISYSDGFQAQMLVRKVNATRKIAWIHSNYKNYFQSKETYQAFSKIDLAVTVSKFAFSAFKDCYYDALKEPFPKPCAFVHNATDPHEIILRANSYMPPPKTHFRIVTVGRISHEKGTDLIPKIAKILHNQKIDFEWYIIGSGNSIFEANVREESKELTELHFTGMLQNPMPYVKSADLIVQPSRSEAACVTIVEGLTIKKPICASDIPAFQEQLQDLGVLHPLIAKDSSPESFATAIATFIQDPAVRSKYTIPATLPTDPSNVKKEFARIL